MSFFRELASIVVSRWMTRNIVSSVATAPESSFSFSHRPARHVGFPSSERLQDRRYARTVSS